MFQADTLRRQLEGAPAGLTTNAERNVTVTTGVDIQELATDNAFDAPSSTKTGDFITTVRPFLSVNAQTAHLTGNFTYAPSVNYYLLNPSASYFGQNFQGTGLATLVPNLLFLDVRAFAGLQSVAPGAGPNTTTTQGPQSQVQTTTFSASPYLQQTFGGTGTLKVGATVSSNSSSALSTFGTSPLVPVATNTNTDANYLSTEEHASFATGEDFGRLSHKVAVSFTQYTGQGVYSGAYRDLETYDLGLAVSRFITLLGEIGHESIYYNGLPAVRIDDAVWSVGTKLVPNGDSSLTLAYGHHDGGDAATVDGHYDATARLRLAARYTENLTSNSEDIADALASVDTTLPGGVFTDANGAPINIGNNFFGLQNGIYRQRRASATASLLYTRDIFSVSVVQQSERIVAASSALNAGNGGKGTYGSLSWAHDLSPSLQSNMFVQYGTISSLPNALTQNTVAQTSSNGTSIVLNATFTYILTDKLKTFAQYGFNRNESSTPGQSTTQNFILVGVHKQF